MVMKKADQGASKKKWTNKRILLLVGGGMLLLFLGLYFFNVFAGGEAEEEEVYTLYTVRENDPLLFDGRVEAENTQQVFYDPTLGVVAEIHVEEGETVEEGAALVSYTNEENQLALEEQRRIVSRAQDRVQSAETDLADAQQALNTAEANLAQAEEANQVMEVGEDHDFSPDLSVIENDQMQYEAEKAEAQAEIETAEATIQEWEEQIEDAQIEINRLEEEITTTITAHFSGNVRVNEMEESQLEGSEDSFVEVISEEIEVLSSVSEYDYYTLSEGEEVTILPLQSNEEVSGTIVEIGKMPLSATGEEELGSRYPFIIHPEEAIHYGFNVEVQYNDGTIFLPDSVMQYDEESEEPYVFVYTEEGTVEKREVVIEEGEQVVELQSGLEADEEVVMEPSSTLQDGDSIAVIYDYD